MAISFSIIVPIYNAAQPLKMCIESIICQKNTDFELILINDGSTDESGKICDEYAQHDKRIRVFHSTNKGVSAARNIGIDNAKGEWITFIDADDYIEQEYLPYKFNPEADLLIQKYEYTNSTTLEQHPQKATFSKRKYKKYLKENLHRHIFRVPWGKFFKKNIISENIIRFDTNYKIGEDTLFVINYLQYCKGIEVIANSTYKHCRNLQPNKYRQDTDTTISYLELIYEKYKCLKLKNKIYLNSIISYLESITIIENETEQQKYDNNNVVKKYKKAINNRTFMELLLEHLYKIYLHTKGYYKKIISFR